MVKETIERLNHSAESIRNTDPQDLSNMEVGDEFRQGDLRLIRLSDDFVAKRKGEIEEIKNPTSQLAPGTTQGSRHILRKMKGVKMFRLVGGTPLDGPIFVTPAGNAIDHPEHGDVINLPEGTYACPGQRAFADELRRVAD